MQLMIHYLIHSIFGLLFIPIAIGITIAAPGDKQNFSSFFALLACMNFLTLLIKALLHDIHHYERDLCIHPNRPLPRGDISKKQGIKYSRLLAFFLIIITAVLVFRGFIQESLFYIITLSMLYFYANISHKWEKKYPLIALFIEESYLIPLSLFTAAFKQTIGFSLEETMHFACLVYLLFVYHKVAAYTPHQKDDLSPSFLKRYGSTNTFIIFLLLITLISVNTFYLVDNFLPFALFQQLLLTSSSLVFFKDKSIYLTLFSKISILFHLWYHSIG